MLNLSFEELFLRLIPEMFLYVFAVYAFSKTVLNLKKCIISSLVLAIIIYLIRLLPIQYGVHTILSLIAVILLTVNINKIDTIKAIRSSIIVIILEFICEGINVFIIQYFLKVDINIIFNNPTTKILYGIPSLLIFAVVVTIYYFRALRKKDLRDVLDGENI